eukprot:4739245-Amphidinium_carterae.3
MRSVFTRVTDIPVQPDCAVFSAPVSTGGLGFTSLRREVAAHRVAHILTERYHQRLDHSEWTGESMATFETYAAEADTTVESALGKSLDMLHAEGYQRAMKKLRIPLYKAGIGLNHSAVAPMSMMALPWLQWMLTPFGQFLPDPALRTTLRRRMCLQSIHMLFVAHIIQWLLPTLVAHHWMFMGNIRALVLKDQSDTDTIP